MSSGMDSDSFLSPDFNNNNSDDHTRKYALSGKIMLTAIIILFFVVILMIILHLYARWYLLRVQRRRRSLRHRTTHLVFYMDTTATPSMPVSNTTHGLDQDVLKRLPVFTYMQDHAQGGLDCSVCLCEFEENEKGRLLPKCGHVFHTECIDMWFHSHSTCPLCRDAVELVEDANCVACSSMRSAEGMKVEQDELPTSSGGGPLSRVLSFRRILSRESRRSESCGGGSVADIEAGRETSSSQLDSN